MAFYAHIGNAYATASNLGYTALATIPITGILDTIVSDLADATASGTNNGWSLYDDMRASSTNPILPQLATARGIMGRYPTGQAYQFTFISASITATCNSNYGFNWYQAINVSSTLYAATPTSMSLDGITWYTGLATSIVAANTWNTATLDRPYTGTTAWSSAVYTKINNWIVLKHTGGQKEFYVLLGCPLDRTGGGSLYIQPHEVWDATNHTGATGIWAGRNPPPLETHIIYESAAANPATCKAQMMLWFMTNALGIWTGGLASERMYSLRCLTYIGNLDTSVVRSNDTDALAFIPGQSNYTGMNCGGTDTSAATVNWGGGAIQCLRTISGDPWAMPTGLYQSAVNARNEYQIYPRARWYGMCLDAPIKQANDKFYFTEFDVFQATGNTDNAMMFSNNEGRRGKLRYAKCPINAPQWQHLNTLDADDGYKYIFVNQSVPQYTASGNTTGPWWSFDLSTANSPLSRMTGWAFGTRGTSGLATGQAVGSFFGDYLAYSSANTGGGFSGNFNYILMPISGSGV